MITFIIVVFLIRLGKFKNTKESNMKMFNWMRYCSVSLDISWYRFIRSFTSCGSVLSALH